MGCEKYKTDQNTFERAETKKNQNDIVCKTVNKIEICVMALHFLAQHPMRLSMIISSKKETFSTCNRFSTAKDKLKHLIAQFLPLKQYQWNEKILFYFLNSLKNEHFLLPNIFEFSQDTAYCEYFYQSNGQKKNSTFECSCLVHFATATLMRKIVTPWMEKKRKHLQLEIQCKL